MNTYKQVHFIGIGGYGMSAIAQVMVDLGYEISGSDVAPNERTAALEQKGAQVFIGHQADHVAEKDVVVYSTGIPEDNPELQEAKKQDIPLLHRSQMLGQLLNEKKGIAVTGAHGKTTTSSMIAQAMEQAGTDPTYIIGGEIMGTGSNARAGQGSYVVAEADESDGSFLAYNPTIAVITNIEADHLENFDGNFEKLLEAYRKFLANVKPDGKVILCQDDGYLRELQQDVAERQVITFAIDQPADYRAVAIETGDQTVSFSVQQGEETLGDVALSVPGKHNVYNALATLIVCLEAGMTFEQAKQGLAQFRGTKRRFQVMGEVNDILVVDDYAHHPTEIEATIHAATSSERRIIAVFQPQRYTRTYYLLDEFSRAFGEADRVIIPDIYSPAGEEAIEGVNSQRLVEMIQENSNENAVYLASKADVLEELKRMVQPGDLVLTMGAGDIWKVAVDLVQELEQNV